MATLGSTPKALAVSALTIAIWARSSLLGFMLTAQSPGQQKQHGIRPRGWNNGVGINVIRILTCRNKLDMSKKGAMIAALVVSGRVIAW